MGLLNTLLRLRPRTPLEIALGAVLGRSSRRRTLAGRPTLVDRLTGRTRRPANPLVALLGGLVASRVLGGRRRGGLLPGVLGAVATAALGGSRGRRR